MLKNILCAAAGGALVYWWLKRDCGCHAATATTTASTSSGATSQSASLAKACPDCTFANNNLSGGFAL